MLDRYPPQDWKDHAFSAPSVSLFCFPSGIEVVSEPSLPIFFTFVMTEGMGTRIFGFSLVFHEPLSESKFPNHIPPHAQQANEDHTGTVPAHRRTASGLKRNQLFEPKCICLLSHQPFYHSFKQFLCEVYRISCSEQLVPIERVICNLFEVPLPPLGRIRVNMSISNKTIPFWRPPPNALPMADFPMEVLFYCLDTDNLLTLFTCVLLERKIVFLSSKYALLTIATECILALVFPFRWQGGYVPVLPVPLLDFVSAPVPFIMGAQKDSFSTALLDPEVVAVDLDTNTISGGVQLPEVPRKELVKLRKCIKSFADIFNQQHPILQTIEDAFRHPPPPDNIDEFDLADITTDQTVDATESSHVPSGDEVVERGKFHRRQLRASFLRFFVALIGKYRKYIDEKMLKGSIALSADTAFNKKAFLEDFQKVDKPFISEMVSTQMWNVLITERLEYHRALVLKQQAHANSFVECRFFDECIDIKDNRSKLHMYKKGTPFLSLNRYAIKEDFNVKPPDTRDIQPGTRFKYPGFPTFRSEMMHQREMTEVLEEQDIRSGATAGKTALGVTMAALLKGRESSLFQSSNKDTAIIHMLQSELDSQRSRLTELLSRVETRDAELRAKDTRLDSQRLENAALHVEVAQLRMRAPAASPSRTMRNSVSSTSSLFSTGLKLPEDHSMQFANSAQTAAQEFTVDPPVLRLVNQINRNMDTLEQHMIAALNRQNLRIQLLAHNTRTLQLHFRARKLSHLAEESPTKPSSPPMPTSVATDLASYTPRRTQSTLTPAPRRHTLVGEAAGDGSKVHSPNSTKDKLAKQMLERAESSVRLLLAQFPERCTMSDKHWATLCVEARDHARVLETQMGSAMMQIARQASSLEEARAVLRKTPESTAMAGDSPHLMQYLKCNEMLSELQQIVQLLECLEAVQPQEPDWSRVMDCKRHLQELVVSTTATGSRVVPFEDTTL